VAASLLASLSRAERLAWSAVRGAVYRTETATSALAEYRGAGGSIRSSTWYKLFKSTREMYERGSQFRYLPRSSKPSLEKIPYNVGTQQRRFSYVFEIRGLAPRQTGHDAYYATVSTSDLLTRGQAESALRARMGLVSGGAQGSIDDYVLVRVTQQTPEYEEE
jgi:hypothetical protein